MKLIIRLLLLFVSFLHFSKAFSQSLNDSIRKDDLEKTVRFLASDKLKGRVNFSKEQLEVAQYLNNEFSSYGLEPFPGLSNFYFPFRTSSGSRRDGGRLKWNGEKKDDSVFIFLPGSLNDSSYNLDDFFLLQALPPLADSILFYNWKSTGTKLLLWVVLNDSLSFSEATKKIILPAGLPASDILIVGSKEEPIDLNFLTAKNDKSNYLYNVIGMLPGRNLAQEAVIFSAHYDHVENALGGISAELFNGANDNASGTAAVLALAKYFSMRKDNERTIIFCLFAGEELGLLGSKAFVNQIEPESIKAVINIEMIGMTNATGKNAFMVTGSFYSSLADILRKNLQGEKFKVLNLNYDAKLLFQRSDNYPFAMEGIPAHSIMCSDDNEPCYHKPCDDAKRINFENMAAVTRAIAKSCTSLLSGKDTPSRIKKIAK